MKILLTNIFPKNANPLLAYPEWGGGDDSAEGTQNFQKGRQAPPPWGRVSKPLKKGLRLMPRGPFATGRISVCVWRPGHVTNIRLFD